MHNSSKALMDSLKHDHGDAEKGGDDKSLSRKASSSSSSGSHVIEKGEQEGRAEWTNHCEFFLSSLGLAVGLGNIWRFPYICYENGGATFLIPYLLMLAFVALPLFFLEMVAGQYAGLSATKIFARVAPGLQGLGYGMIATNCVVNVQYVVIMAYALFYVFSGFTSKLPWGTCDHDYNSPHCWSKIEFDACNTTLYQAYFNQTCLTGEDFCGRFPAPEGNPGNFSYDEKEYPDGCQYYNGVNMTNVPFIDVTYRVSGSEDYWYHRTLNIAVENGHLDLNVNSWEKWGGIRWEIVGCLALSWVIICVSLIGGISSYGKVVYFTTLFPYVVLTIMLGYVATLPGFGLGIDYYMVPRKLDSLLSIDIWNAAAGQIFYSLGVAFGSQLLLSSYNEFTANAHQDALLIAAGNSATSIYAGFTVFGVIGYLAKSKGVDISEVVSAGPGLAFIVYPEAVSLMDVPPLFSFLFFFMLNLLAISTLCGSWEALVAALLDEFPILRTKRVIIMIVSCFIAFLCGLSMCFDSGFLMFSIINDRAGNSILLLGFIELVMLCWFYGSSKMLRHVEEMGMRIPRFMYWYWWSCWTIITPIILIIVTVFQWANYPGDLFEDYNFPTGVQVMGWMLEMLGVVIVVVGAIMEMVRRLRAGEPASSIAFVKTGPMMSPSPLWGPRADSRLATAKKDAAEVNKGFES